MSISYILVANGSEASVYSAPRVKLLNGFDNLSLVFNEIHPASRLRARDTLSDRAGHSHLGNFHNDGSDWHQGEMQVFAKTLSHWLKHDYDLHKFSDLIVIAPPKFHGKLNHCLERQLKNSIRLNIEKDYTKMKKNQLISRLKTYL